MHPELRQADRTLRHTLRKRTLRSARGRKCITYSVYLRAATSCSLEFPGTPRWRASVLSAARGILWRSWADSLGPPGGVPVPAVAPGFGVAETLAAEGEAVVEGGGAAEERDPFGIPLNVAAPMVLRPLWQEARSSEQATSLEAW